MGILDDTLSDAAQPLPQLALHRASDGGDPDFSADTPAEDGEALTVFRLQKDGGHAPPAAPPAPRAVDAGAPAAGPLHAPVGIFNDASLQFVTSIDGLETGKGQASTWNSDATDRQQRPDSPDSSLQYDYVDSTGSQVFSSQVPSPFDDPGKSVQRIDSSDGMRRATGRGAPSGDPSPQLADAIHSDATTPSSARLASPQATPPSTAADKPATAAQDRSASPTPPTSLTEALSAAARQTVSAHVQAHSGDAHGAAQATPGGKQRGMVVPADSPRDADARLSIGRIEVTVLAPAQPKPQAAAPARSDAFLSKHYLRRL